MLPAPQPASDARHPFVGARVEGVDRVTDFGQQEIQSIFGPALEKYGHLGPNWGEPGFFLLAHVGLVRFSPFFHFWLFEDTQFQNAAKWIHIES